MRVMDASDVARALPMGALVAALRAQFARGAEVPPRQVLALAPEGSGLPAVTSLVMPAWQPGRYYAVKVINIAPGNAARGLPGLHASVLLHDAATGVPLALMDGNEITARRTAAASALAASCIAPADAGDLLVVGAGRVAALLPAAYAAVRPLRRVRVWARRADAARALVDRWRAEGMASAEAVPPGGLAAAVAAADVVSCATLATEPVVQGAWLRAGTHLDLIGSFTPAMREADDACFAHAALYVDTEEALAKSGELLGPMSRGVFAPDAVLGTLADLVAHTARPRPPGAHHTVFKSVGTALEDLAAAVLVWENRDVRRGGHPAQCTP